MFSFKRYKSTVILAGTLLVVSVISLFIGVLDLDMGALFSGDSGNLQIFLLSRVPRLLAVLCTGVGMSVAGLIMQQLCRNRFVSPTTGATIQSAQLGIAVAMIFLPTMGLFTRTIFAFVFAVAGTLLFVVFTQKIKIKDTFLVPLIGIMFGNIIGGITSFLSWQFEINQQLSTYFSGSFSLIIRGKYELVWLIVPLVVLAFVYANHFNIVGIGQEFSKNLGVNYNWILFLGLVIASTITASVVVVVGQISYIGLIIPNLVVLFKGDKLRGTLLDTGLFGALFVLLCDIIARTVILPFEIPIELVVGIIGSLVFVAMLFYKLRHGKHGSRLLRGRKHSRHPGHHHRNHRKRKEVSEYG